jgi:hypothetical protein
MCVEVRVCLCTYAFACMHASVCVYVRACVVSCLYVCDCVHACVHACVNMCICVGICVCVHACACVQNDPRMLAGRPIHVHRCRPVCRHAAFRRPAFNMRIAATPLYRALRHLSCDFAGKSGLPNVKFTFHSTSTRDPRGK